MKSSRDMSDEISKNISEARKLSGNPYAYKNGMNDYVIVTSNTESMTTSPFVLPPGALKEISVGEGKARKGQGRSNIEIKQVVKKLHAKMWKHRSQIWQNNVPTKPVDMLDPSVGLELLGYDYEVSDSLGQFSNNGKSMGVAGIIDRSSKLVRISRQLPFNTRKFTAAHELGHALLHETTGLHRDKALDGTKISGVREPIEMEADKFATYFLMPENLVKETFRQRYGTDCFSLNEDTIFAHSLNNSKKLQRNCKSLRDLSRILAGAEEYNSQFFNSLAEMFGVSAEAMAIRLEELELLEF